MQERILRSLCFLLLIGSTCYGQSVADAARENRQQKPAESTVAKRVISTDDLSAAEVIHLVPGQRATGQGTVVAPGRGKHSYHVIMLDASQFTNGGTIHIAVTMGDGPSETSFDLYSQNGALAEGGFPSSLAEVRNVASGSDAKLKYHFAHGAVFQFAAEGSWNAKAGSTNTYSFVVSVE